MQRRAAALYAALFIVLSVGAYAMIGVAEEPAIEVADPDHSLAAGDELSVQGRTYTVAEIGDGRARLTWVAEGVEFSESWEVGAAAADAPPSGESAAAIAANADLPTVTLGDTDYRAVVASGAADPGTLHLVAAVSLSEDVTTQTVDGEPYVVVSRPAGPELVPLGTYVLDEFGEPEVRSVDEGGRLTYQDAPARLAAVTNETASVEWIGTEENAVSMSEGDLVDLNGAEFYAHFPQPTTLELTSDTAGYEREVAAVETYEERVNGLWGVTIVGSLAAITVLALAYLPSRY